MGNVTRVPRTEKHEKELMRRLRGHVYRRWKTATADGAPRDRKETFEAGRRLEDTQRERL